MTCYVYALVDPRTDEIRYVGCTTKSVSERFHGHVKSTRYEKQNRYSVQWFRQVLTHGLIPEIRVLQSYDTREDMLAGEVKWIAKLRDEGARLTNVMAGGVAGRYGSHTDTTRAKMRAAWTDERRAAQSERMRVVNPNPRRAS